MSIQLLPAEVYMPVPNEFTGANADGPPCLATRKLRAAHAAQFLRWAAMRTLAFSVLLLAVALLSSGCGSTLCLASKKHLERFHGGAEPVYVTNPEIGREYEILKASGIYTLSVAPEGARKLTLHPIHQYGRCANPLMLSAITLGIIPGVLPAARAFEYDLESGAGPEPYVHWLPLYERFSIWERLVRRDEHKVLTEALRWSAPQRRPNLQGGVNGGQPSGSEANPASGAAAPRGSP